ncbi:Chromatin modification-related protein [Lachnellula willkommii]|uniref:Chromatin modification-related protein YNG2 n=1 Tax=Lachnellula willkommii TaxID=215461 RepID=A0A559LYJ7_9HELO|nr:Chromatin modification-related protein [Lachnellula willkommii]
MPLNTIANPPSMPHTRHPNQYPVRVPGAVSQARQSTGQANSAPATPAAAMLGRQVRESSLGAASKRQRLTGGLGPLPPSGLARHSSMTPGTPRAGTPSGGRAGSAGPRSSQKTVATKKAAPAGSRQSGVLRKGKPTKSGLSRLKRANKNSPSSTNDSELSDAESGTGDDDDEAVTPGGRHGDGDEEMLDLDDDEGSDDKKYCMCQNVSFGDMVACDNDSCPFEWFHWSCVGLKSEPIGTWICPINSQALLLAKHTHIPVSMPMPIAPPPPPPPEPPRTATLRQPVRSMQNHAQRLHLLLGYPVCAQSEYVGVGEEDDPVGWGAVEEEAAEGDAGGCCAGFG